MAFGIVNGEGTYLESRYHVSRIRRTSRGCKRWFGGSTNRNEQCTDRVVAMMVAHAVGVQIGSVPIWRSVCRVVIANVPGCSRAGNGATIMIQRR